MAGAVLLGTGTRVGYLRLLPLLIGRRERLFAALVVAQIVILALAASGVAAAHRRWC